MHNIEDIDEKTTAASTLQIEAANSEIVGRLKKKIAILLAAILLFTMFLAAISITFISFVPDGDRWWMWVVWTVWSIIFIIGIVELYNSIRYVNKSTLKY